MRETSESLGEIFNEFNYDNWINWIQDIVQFKIAYPLYSLSANGDVLSEIIDFLRQNKISVFLYEQALSACFAKEYKQNIVNTYLQERYLRAMIHLSSDSCNQVLVSILDSKVNTRFKGVNDYIKTLALLVLTKSPNLSFTQRSETLRYIQDRGIYEMEHDSYFFSTSLRFCYKQVSVKEFFLTLTRIVLVVDTLEEKRKDIILYLLIDKIDELYYYKPSILSKSLRNWIIEDFQQTNLDLSNNKFAKLLLWELGQRFHSSQYHIPLHPLQPTNIHYSVLSTELILSILLNWDCSSSDLLNNEEELINVFVCMIQKKKLFQYLKNIMSSNIEFVQSTKIRLILFLIEDRQDQISIKLCGLLDSVIFSSSNTTSKSPAGIFALTNETVLDE